MRLGSDRARLDSDRVLRALARFDVATTEEVAQSLGRGGRGQQRSVWRHLQQLVAAGHASRKDERGSFPRYTITDTGRATITRQS